MNDTEALNLADALGRQSHVHRSAGVAAEEYLLEADACELIRGLVSELGQLRAALEPEPFDPWERAATTGQRKRFDDYNVPPEGDGWELDPDSGVNGQSWERFEYHEERYWRRKKPQTPDDTP